MSKRTTKKSLIQKRTGRNNLTVKTINAICQDASTADFSRLKVTIPVEFRKFTCNKNQRYRVLVVNVTF